MNKLIILFITAIIAFSLTGCWGTATETVNTETANANKKPDANLQTMGNYDINTAGNSPETTQVNTQEGNQNPGIQIQTNKVGNHVRSGVPGEDTEAMKRAAKNGQFLPAPENSFISNEMNKAGNPVQTRKFNGHPTIDRVEIITFGEKNNKRLLYLKDGKVLPLEEGNTINPMTASSYQLLTAVGIEVKSPPSESKKEK